MVTIYVNTSNDERQDEKTDKVVDSSIAFGPTEKFEDNKLSIIIQKFLALYELKVDRKKQYIDAPIQVSEVLGKLAHLYEKVRTTIEYKGEHVLRRNAIERMLKRLVWEQEGLKTNLNSKKIAETLLRELIWARYLPNNTVPSSFIDDTALVVDKYIYLLENISLLPSKSSPAVVRSWIWGVASSEIEDLLDPSNRELYVQLMFDWFNNYFHWSDDNLKEHEKEIQIYLAIHRALPKSDEPIMRFHLLLHEFPNWRNAEQSDIDKFIKRFPFLFSEIEGHLHYPGRMVLYRKLQKHAGAFEIFKTVAEKEKENLRVTLKSEKKLESVIRKVCDIKYKDIKRKVNTGIVRSIIYIFITKVVLAMFIEVPYEIYRYDEIRYLPLAINIIFPPMLMWFIGTTISIPGEINTTSIVEKIRTIVYKAEKKPQHTFSLQAVKTRSSLVKLFGFFYILSFALIFGLLTLTLFSLNFTFLGILIFFMFMSLVLLFSLRVSFNAKQLRVESEKESALGHLFNYLTLPFLNFGYYLSKGLSKFNFLTILLDFLIEAPLKSVIDLFEEWTSFMREKKEEVVEQPE